MITCKKHYRYYICMSEDKHWLEPHLVSRVIYVERNKYFILLSWLEKRRRTPTTVINSFRILISSTRIGCFYFPRDRLNVLISSTVDRIYTMAILSDLATWKWSSTAPIEWRCVFVHISRPHHILDKCRTWLWIDLTVVIPMMLSGTHIGGSRPENVQV